MTLYAYVLFLLAIASGGFIGFGFGVKSAVDRAMAQFQANGIAKICFVTGFGGVVALMVILFVLTSWKGA